MTIRSYAKVNIFLKMLGTRGNYHELISRFMRLDNLYDTLHFKQKEHQSDTFELLGNFSCSVEKNSIFKAYLALLNHTKSTKLELYFHQHLIEVEKNIPEFAGLGGGSSNAAAFLRLCNQTLHLKLNDTTLAKIGASIGADVPFFLYNYPSANVFGIGEVVELFEEAPLRIETFTPKIACDTGLVYARFREAYLAKIDTQKAKMLATLPSSEIVANHDTYTLNDLFAPALDIYPALGSYHDSNFFSGSGSTFFKVNHG